MDGYDAAQYAFYTVFLTLCVICYGYEIATRTPWTTLSQKCRALLKKSRDSSTLQPHTPQGKDTSTGSIKAARLDRISGAQVNEVDASTKQGHLTSGDSAAEEGISSQTRATSKLPLLAWVICLPGWVWALSIVPALLHLFTNAAPGHAVPLTTVVPNWNVNRTFGSDIRLLTDVNPDIGGLGIRIGFYIPLGLALLTLVAGLFHKEDSAAKEIGSALLLTLFYLNFNAVKAAAPKYQQLTFPEVVLVCISLDLTAATLHMTSSGKDTLAARKFIFVSTLNQLVAYGNIIAMLARIRHNYKGLDCAYLVWWSRIDSCTGPSGPVWMYIAIRGLIIWHGVWLDWCHTSSFDRIEKDWTGLAPADQNFDDNKDEISKYPYASLPGTVFSKWIDFLPSAVVAVSSLEFTVHRLPPDARITDWGQSAALVFAIAGAVHWFYVLNWQIGSKLWRGRKKQELNFPRYDKGWNPRIIGTNDELIRASKAGDTKSIRRALNHGADKDYREPETGKTALLYAVRRDNLDLVQELSDEYGANLCVPGTIPAMLYAAKNGSNDVLKFLLHRKDLDLEMLHDDKDIIRFATQSGNLSTIKLILNAWQRVSPNEGIKNGLKLADDRPEPALVVAVEKNYQDVIRYLAKKLRDDNLTASYAKALEVATMMRDETALKALLSYDPDPKAIRAQLARWPLLHEAIATVHESVSLTFLIRAYHNIADTVDVFNARGHTPLVLAAVHDNSTAVKLLLDLGANPFAKKAEDSDDAEIPFMLACTAAARQKVKPGGPWPEFTRKSHISLLRYFNSERFPVDRRNPDSPVSLMIRYVMDSEAFLSHLLGLPNDVLEFLINREYLTFDTLVGSGEVPLFCAILEARTVAPLKYLLLHYVRMYPHQIRYDFELALERLEEQDVASESTSSEKRLRLANDLDEKLSHMPQHVLERCKIRLGHRESWAKCGPEIQEVLSKHAFVDPSPRPSSSHARKGYRGTVDE